MRAIPGSRARRCIKASASGLIAAVLAAVPPVFLAACRDDRPGDAAADRGASPSTPSFDAATVSEMNRAVGLMGKFEFALAADAFAAVAAANPGLVEARLNHAIAVLNQSSESAQEKAAEQLRMILRSEPAPAIALRARYCLALCELYLGRAAEAVPHFVAVAEKRSIDAYALYFAGQSLEQAGDPAKALGWYERAVERDPMLKSAVLGVQRCARRSGDEAKAERALAQFEKLAENPRARSAEFKYTRMGDMGRALVLDDPTRAQYQPPRGELFAAAAPVALTGAAAGSLRWSTDVAQHAATVDLDGDGRLDIVVTRAIVPASGTGDATTLVMLSRGEGRYEPVPDHPLARIGGTAVNSILFGDIDGDGRVDAYMCRNGGNRLAIQDPQGGFTDATAAWSAEGRPALCNDGALADLDHDGDLDLVLLYREGLNEILANTGDGRFRPIGVESGFATEERASRSVIVADFDYDRDADILLLNEVPSHELFLNDRLWKWRKGTAPGVTADQLAEAAQSIALVEIADLPLRRAFFAVESYLRLPTRIERIAPTRGLELGVADASGDGHQDLFLFGSERIAIHDESGRLVQELPVPPQSVRTQLAMLDPVRGPHLITLRNGQPPLLWEPGPGRGPFVALSFGGRSDPSQAMRSNGSGIGTAYAARVGTEWFGGETFRPTTGRCQSLAPVAIGTGPFAKADLVEIEWSDGVFQTEIDLDAPGLHAIAETQRQISSCPVLFAFNGREMSFVSDLLGVGGIGYLLEPGVYAEPRPRETFTLPEAALAPRADGTLSIALAEPMEESCMLDAVRLRAIDLPAGWDIAADERLGIGGAPPSGELIAWSRGWLPLGNATLERADLLAADPGPLDPRFIGRLAGEQVIEVTFDTAIDILPDPWLVVDGWIEYPYCQTMFAAWQAGAKFHAPSLEARAGDGSWVELVPEWGYPAGMPRRLALPIPREKLPVGCTTIRMRTNMEIYFDSVRLVSREALPRQPVECGLKSARLASPGFARRTTGPQKQPFYDRGRMLPLWDCRFQRGLYTEFGDVRGLLQRDDGAPVVFGPGEEVAIDFTAPQPVAEGSTRRFVLELRGWCKDMDLFTRGGETVDPMPVEPVDADAAKLLRSTRTRPGGGR